MKKVERVDFRFTPEIKELLKSSAKKQHLTQSEYVRNLIVQNAHCLSHEQLIQNSLSENQFINELLTNPKLPNKSKQLIGEELRNYV